MNRSSIRLFPVLLAAALACGDEEADPQRLVNVADATPEQCAHGGTVVQTGVDEDESGALDPAEVASEQTFCNGAPGDTGETGPDAPRARVRVAEEPAGANCPTGGQRVDVGLDDDGSGTLDTGEVDATTYVCRGPDGAPAPALLTETSTAVDGRCADGGTRLRTGVDSDGNGRLEEAEVTDERYVCAGRAGAPLLVQVDDEPPGSSCPVGGRRIRSGLDADRDGTLAPSEVGDEDFVCDPVQSRVETTPLAAGTSTVCPGGGTRIDSGLDANGDGALEAAEIDDTTFVCRGQDAAPALAAQTTEPAGANCPLGGFRIAVGPDENRNGTLETSEERSVSYVCDAADGADATGSAVRVSTEPPGANCAAGGVRLQTGPDANGDGVLADAEVTATRYVCDDTAAVALVDVAPEPPGASCTEGGQRIRAGLDADGDGALDAGEVTSTAFACSTVVQPPIGVATTSLSDAILDNPYGADVTAAGGVGGGYTWSVVQGSLPPGLSLGASGTPSTSFTGRPTQAGTFSFTVRVTDFFGNSADQALTLTVREPVAVTSLVLPRVEAGTAYSANLTATGGTPPYTWAVVAGSLPSGLSLSSGGALSGTPGAFGARFIVSVTDASGDATRAGLEIKGEQRFLAYCGDHVTNGQDDVSVVPVSPTGTFTSTGTVITPADPMGTPGDVSFCSDVAFSPGSNQLAMIVDVGSGNELFVQDLGSLGSAPVRINGPLVASGDVTDLAWSPDGRYLAYRADEDTNGDFELYLADLSAFPTVTVVKVNRAFTGSQDVETDFAFTPDSQRLVYRSDEITSGTEDLFVFAVGGTAGSSARVNPSLFTGDVDSDWALSPDSRYVLYAAQQDSTDYELYLADISGMSPGTPVKMNPPLDGGELGGSTIGPSSGDIGFSPNGAWIHFIADIGGQGDELWVRNIAQTSATPQLASFETTSSLLDVTSAVWSPDGRRIAFIGDPAASGVTEVYFADTLLLGSPVRLTPSYDGTFTDASGLSGDADVEWLPSGIGLLYRADQDVDGNLEPYYVAVAQPGITTRVFPMGLSDDAFDIEITDSGVRGYVTAEAAGTSDVGLYTFIIGATAAPTRVNPPLGSFEDVLSTSIVVTAAGDVAYRGDVTSNGDTQAWFSEIVNGSPSTPSALNPPLPASGDVDEIFLQAE